ncbi:18954_t:CDS:2 [Entrophospora sp. SA101]|nr:18954_t:CDS:2 [Entrophospora sp. SA101]
MIFEHGSIVLAKLKGFPWWPAKIEKENKIPEHILKKKPKHQNTIPVKFFGTNDYGFVNKKDIKQFDMNKAKDMIKKKTNKKLVESTGYGVRSIKKESDVNADNSSSDKKPIIRARRTYKRSVNNKDQSVNDDKNTSNNKSPGKIGNDDDDKNAVTDNHKQEVDGDKEMVNSDQQDDKQEVNGDQNVSNEVKINNSSNNNVNVNDENDKKPGTHRTFRTTNKRSSKNDETITAINDNKEREGEGKQDGIDKKPAARVSRINKRSYDNHEDSSKTTREKKKRKDNAGGVVVLFTNNDTSSTKNAADNTDGITDAFDPTTNTINGEEEIDKMNIDESNKGEEKKEITTSNGESSIEINNEDMEAIEINKSNLDENNVEKLLDLRRQIQKHALNKDDINEREMKVINNKFTEIENISATIQQIKESKMGILMHKMSEKTINNDTFNIVGRSLNLVNKWKKLIDEQDQ